MGNKKVLVSITTLSEKNIKNDWKAQIEEINNYQFSEVALFLTMLERSERDELYNLLGKSVVNNIPHVHIRVDMKIEELDHLVEKYNTQFFNLHSFTEYPLLEDYSKYFSKIYFENARVIPSEDELSRCGGLCLDFAHWEDKKLSRDEKYCADLEDKIKKYKIGCCHVSAIKEKAANYSPYFSGRVQYDVHSFENLSEFDYIKKYVRYLPEYISLELENSIEKQLEAKKYIEEIIKEKENESR